MHIICHIKIVVSFIKYVITNITDNLILGTLLIYMFVRRELKHDIWQSL